MPENVARQKLMETVHDRHLAPLVHILYEEYFLKKPYERNDEIIADTFKKIQKTLSWVNAQLEGQTYFGGTFFSTADAAFVHSLANWLPQFNVDISGHPHVATWLAKIKKRESVKKTDPGLFRYPKMNPASSSSQSKPRASAILNQAVLASIKENPKANRVGLTKGKAQ